MKFVFPLLNLNKSGGVRIAIQYAEGLFNLGYSVTILTTPPNYNSFIPSNNIKVEYVLKGKNFRINNIILLLSINNES